MSCQKIPASIVLPPRELRHYKRWQGLYTAVRPAEQGYLPTAREYGDFQQWLKRQDSGYFSDIFEDISGHISPSPLDSAASMFDCPIATVCQHRMHPVAAVQRWSRCPVCTIDMHVKYMEMLTQTLRSAGGHAPSCTLTSSDHQDTVYSAWCHGKLDTLEELSKLETMAEEEAAWTTQHPEAAFEDVRTAADALELYWSETADSPAFSPQTKKAGAVTFAQGTEFEPGRPNPYFHTKSPRYAPGKYTVIRREDDDDQISEDSEDYFQATVYHVGATEEQECRPLGEEDNFRLGRVPEEDFQEDDSDSDWEDIESDEDSSDYDDEDDEIGCTYLSIEEETSFIVFGDD